MKANLTIIRSTALVAMVFGLTACAPATSESPQTGQSQVEGITVVPELNGATGVVKLPLSPFGEDRNESTTLTTGYTALVSLCALERGVDYQVFPEFPESVQSIYAQEHYFGVWTDSQAERWGFVEPATQKDLIANGIIPEETPATDTFLPPQAGHRAIHEVNEEESAIIMECDGLVDQQFFQVLVHDGGWWQEYEPLEFNYKRNKQAVALVDELGACYAENGLVPESREDAPWYPQGARGDRIDEEQIGLALQVVACKDSINFTQRMAEIEAAEQVPLIKKYAAEMIAKRVQIDTAVAAAKKVIAENPDRLLKVNPEHKP